MKQHVLLTFILSVSVVLASACSTPQDDALPTVIQLPTDEPIATDMPPTEVEITATVTATIVTNSTLPPTWTLTPDYTDTPIPTATDIPITVTPLPAPDTVSAACDTFAADPERSTREFIIGESPVAAWTPVEGAELYRVFLSTFSLKLIRDDIYTDQTSWTFDPNSFELGENYIWAVWPLDSIGDQMCFERGLELLPQRPPINSGG